MAFEKIEIRLHRRHRRTRSAGHVARDREICGLTPQERRSQSRIRAACPRAVAILSLFYCELIRHVRQPDHSRRADSLNRSGPSDSFSRLTLCTTPVANSAEDLFCAASERLFVVGTD